jgi:integrase
VVSRLHRRGQIDAIKEFQKWAEADKKPGTVEFYACCFKALGRSFAGTKLSDIHPFLIEKYKQMRVREGHPVGANRELTALKVLFNRCRDWRKFEGENPVRTVKRLDEPLTKVRFLTAEEEEKLLAEAAPDLRPIILAGIYAGLRIRAEALTLKWENVDLERRFITIEATYSKNREVQTIPIHSKLLAALKELFVVGRGEHVFAKADGNWHKSIRTAFTNACQRAKLTGVTPHTLRHTFASRLAMEGVNDVTLQTLGRWKEPRMIRRYAHLSQEHLAEVVEKIGSHSPTVFTTLKVASS